MLDYMAVLKDKFNIGGGEQRRCVGAVHLKYCAPTPASTRLALALITTLP